MAEKTKWRKYEDLGLLHSRGNHKGCQDNGDAGGQKSHAEAAEGLMQEGPDADLVALFPGGELLLRVGRGSPKACDDTFEVIHGGTHGVGYNPRNKVRDQLMGPGLA